MKKRIVTLVLCLCLGAGMVGVAGCGNSADEEAAAEVNADIDKVEAASAETEAQNEELQDTADEIASATKETDPEVGDAAESTAAAEEIENDMALDQETDELSDDAAAAVSNE
ncbi:MAG: hypothetical protein LIO56_05795 [Lachnospiraceae bacterium]|nr:hypothetical protein [Lachnospiraceae bacterium]